MKTRRQILAEGFIIDDDCYPPLAYKGPRFDPTEAFEILTKLEEELLKNMQWINNIISTTCDGGDAWCAVRNRLGAKKWAVDLQTLIKQTKERTFKRFR